MSRHEVGERAGSVLLRRIRSGTSGAEVFLLQQPSGTTVATKVSRNPRVRSSAQAQRRGIMAGHLPASTPAVLATASEAELDVIVTAAPATWTLDEAVDRHGPTAQLRAVWSDVVASLSDMWQATARPVSVRGRPRGITICVAGAASVAGLCPLGYLRLSGDLVKPGGQRHPRRKLVGRHGSATRAGHDESGDKTAVAEHL